MMKLKIGRYYFEITSKDRVGDNGACQMLVTQIETTWNGAWRNQFHPTISKAKFKKYVKEGILVFTYQKDCMKYYKFDLEKLAKHLENNI